MTKMIFVNLPVADVEASTAFYAALGFRKDESFCQESTAAMMVASDTITFMLLSHARFADFTPKTIVDARTSAQMLICLSAENRAEVDQTIERAVAAGGTAHPITQEEVSDFMYGRSFEDLDGHGIEVMWMDVDKAMAARSDPAAQAEPA